MGDPDSPDVLIREGLSEPLRGGRDGSLHERVDLAQEPLPEVSSPLLQAVLLEVAEFGHSVVKLLGSAPVLPLQQGNDARDVLKVLLLQELLQEAPQLTHCGPKKQESLNSNQEQDKEEMVSVR